MVMILLYGSMDYCKSCVDQDKASQLENSADAMEDWLQRTDFHQLRKQLGNANRLEYDKKYINQ